MSGASGKPLRLLVAGVRWPPETFLDRLIRGLLVSGVEVTVACGAEPDRSWRKYAGFRSFNASYWEGSILKRLVRLVGMLLRAFVLDPRTTWRFFSHSVRNGSRADRLRALNRLLPYVGRRWDVVYFPWNSAAIEYQALLDLGPGVVSCRGSQVHVAPHDPRRRDLREGLRESFRKAEAVHCVSEATLREAVLLGLDPSKARVIYAGVDPDVFRPGTIPKRDFDVLRIISTGSLLGVKGHEYAFRAIRLLADRGVAVRLSVVGEGPDRARLMHTIQDLELDQKVELLGRKSPDEVREQLHLADVFLLSSLSEGISNAALEAMACGLPVVTTNCGGMSEAVTDGVEGFVVPLRDPESMAAAIERFDGDQALQNRMGKAARLRVLSDFTLSRHVRAFIDLLEEARVCRAA